LPFILGLHCTVYQQASIQNIVGEETVQVFIDDNKILFGSLGAPPPLPTRRFKKLVHHIYSTAPLFVAEKKNVSNNNNNTTNTTTTSSVDLKVDKNKKEKNGLYVDVVDDKSMWSIKKKRLKNFDNAFSNVSEQSTLFSKKTKNNKKTTAEEDDGNEDILNINNNSGVNEKVLREGFLKFFVSILKDYKNFLFFFFIFFLK
jgi:hypothetical protein